MVTKGVITNDSVDYLQINVRLNIEVLRSLVSTLTGNNVQCGGSRKWEKYKDKALNHLN